MMRLTILAADSAVYVDKVCRMPLDLAACGIPSGVRALQWYETRGWIEFSDDDDPFTPPLPNEDIVELPSWANACVTVWEAAAPAAAPQVATAEDNANTAKVLLLETDWAVLPDVPLANKDAFEQYRTVVRQYVVAPTPGSISWPTKPTAVWA